ncbi:hypothetical protein CONPUDRAFT_74480 [Coniophora puteana RWD-64-598 SS2]|uniref:Uncharacterized protein n=1 Tax=Coniophora puteana (strain RWD-64-598) TaxID=741705 RepID=A0A5M3MI76_CONPW|nr:uncharacterized protein CONPUDRAFT_74480 [Coniophora puteana RWD-64-598 SS2]EIW78912.1 hypothetical protein CONPUDRAFT_74480 [Coniophora puteana RWD-64-598 SS2]
MPWARSLLSHVLPTFHLRVIRCCLDPEGPAVLVQSNFYFERFTSESSQSLRKGGSNTAQVVKLGNERPCMSGAANSAFRCLCELQNAKTASRNWMIWPPDGSTLLMRLETATRIAHDVQYASALSRKGASCGKFCLNTVGWDDLPEALKLEERSALEFIPMPPGRQCSQAKLAHEACIFVIVTYKPSLAVLDD